MKKWMSGIRGAVAMVLLWMIGWGVGFGGLIEAFIDPHGELVDIWPAVMGIAGIITGVAFCVVYRIAEGRRSFDEVPLARFAVWGVLAGLALGALAVWIGVPNDIAIDQPYVRPIAVSTLVGITTALGVVAAIGSAIFFRLVARRQSPAAAAPSA